MFETSIFNLDPISLFIISVIYGLEIFLFIGIAMLIKWRIRYGSIDPYRWFGAWAVLTIILIAIAFLNKTFSLIIIWCWGLDFGLEISNIIFNKMNFRIFKVVLEHWDMLIDEVTQRTFICYRKSEFSNIMICIRINEKGNEPFRDLIGRIFGRKRQLIIKDNAAPFKLNKVHQIYLYKELRRHKKTGDYLVIAEPNLKTHSDPAFIKAWEGNYSTKNELENVKEEVVMLTMQKSYLAKIEFRRYIAPLIKSRYPEQYAEFEEVAKKKNEEDKENIEALDEKIKESITKKEEEMKKLYAPMEADELFEEDYTLE